MHIFMWHVEYLQMWIAHWYFGPFQSVSSPYRLLLWCVFFMLCDWSLSFICKRSYFNILLNDSRKSDRSSATWGQVSDGRNFNFCVNYYLKVSRQQLSLAWKLPEATHFYVSESLFDPAGWWKWLLICSAVVSSPRTFIGYGNCVYILKTCGSGFQRVCFLHHRTALKNAVDYKTKH